MPLNKVKYPYLNDTLLINQADINTLDVHSLTVKNLATLAGNLTVDTLTVKSGPAIFNGAVDQNSITQGIHAGILSGTSRLMFVPPGTTSSATNWQIDVDSGVFRWYLPNDLQMSLVNKQLTTGAFVPNNSVVPANGMYLGATNTLTFATNSTERMRLDASGNMFVGDTTTPAGITQLGLMFSTNSSGGANFILRKSFSGLNAANFTFLKSRGTNASPLVVPTDDLLSNLVSYGFDGTNYIEATSIQSYVDNTVSTGVMPARMVFLTTNPSGTSVERMRIDSAGIVTIVNDLAVNGGDITTTATTFNLLNTTATTVNAFGASTTTTIGAATGTTTINSPTLTLPNATAFNINGASPTIGSTSTGTLTFFNTGISTVNEYAAATSINIGSLNSTVTIPGNLVINGTTTTINSSTLTVDDKNIEMASVPTGVLSGTATIGTVSGTGPFLAPLTGLSTTVGFIPGSSITATPGTGTLGAGQVTVVNVVNNTTMNISSTATMTAGSITNITTGPSNTSADGGGITIKGSTDKTIIWDNANANFTTSENWNLATGKTLKITNSNVISGTAAALVIGENATTSTTIGSAVSGSTIINTNLGINGSPSSGQLFVVSTSNTRPTIVSRTANLAGGGVITNAVQSAGGIVTYTSNNSLVAGQRVTITGITPTTYNVANATVASANATTFTISNASLGGTYVSGGTTDISGYNQEWQDFLGVSKLAVDKTGVITTVGTELTFEETGDAFGTTQLRLQNRSGQNGPMFDTSRSLVDLVDFGFQSITTKGTIRLESRVLGFNTVTSGPEFQFGGNPLLGGNGGVLAGSMTAFPLVVGVGFYNRGVQVNSTGASVVPLTVRATPTSTAPITGALVTTFANQTGTLIIPQGVATTHSRITGIASTANYLPGMTLTYVSGVGTFGGGTATIISVDTATSITITSTANTVAGAITFSIQNRVTYTATNTFAAFQTVTVTGATAGTLNVTNATIGSANGTTFTIINTTASGAWSSGGTATVTQTAALTSWTNPAGTSILSVDSTGNLVTGLTSLNVFNTTATTVNAFGAASTINMGVAAGVLNLLSSLTVNRTDASSEGGEIRLNRSVDNATGFTVDVFGATTSPDFRIFNNGGTQILNFSTTGVLTVPNTLTVTGASININGAAPTIATTQTASTAAIFNTSLTTGINIGQAVTGTINIGSASSTTALGGILTVGSTATITGATLNINGVNPILASTSTGTLTLFNTGLLTVNAFGAATTATEFASVTSYALGNTATAAQTVNMFNASTGASTYTLFAGPLTTGTKTINIGTAGAAGSTTSINIGSAVGTTAVSNILLSGKISRPATSQNVPSWTTSGQAFDIVAATFNDTTGTGTIASRVMNSFNTPTLTSTSAVTLTDAANVYISAAPTASTNTTITNGHALWVGGQTRIDGNIVTGTASINLFNATATTLNIGAAATTLALGATTGTATIANATVTLSNATALNINGANPTVASTSTGTLNLFNNNLTTVNAFGAATSLAIGGAGTLQFGSTSVTLSNATAFNINGANPTVASTSTGTLTLFNTGLTTVNAFGAATTSTILPAVTTFTLGGTGTGAITATLFGNATASATTKAINIGSAGASGSVTNITLGSSVAGAIGTTRITGSLALNSPVTNAAATYTVGVNDNFIIFSAASTVTLPAPATYTGRVLTIKNTAAAAIISASANVVPLAGGAASTAILTATAGKFAQLVSDGTNWIIMMAN